MYQKVYQRASIHYIWNSNSFYFDTRTIRNVKVEKGRITSSNRDAILLTGTVKHEGKLKTVWVYDDPNNSWSMSNPPSYETFKPIEIIFQG